jgi:hypothetical protein
VDQNPKCWRSDAQSVFDSFNSSHTYGYRGSLFATTTVSYQYIEVFQTNTALRSLVTAWQTSGGPAPTLKDAQMGLQLRYSVDGTEEHRRSPNCVGPFVPPAGVQEFEYQFQSKLRLWNTRVNQIRVWLCDSSLAVSYVSILNISDALKAMGRPLLEPGPYLTLTLPLSGNINSASVTTMQERFCKVVWTVLDDRCNTRAWLKVVPEKSQLSLTMVFTSNTKVTRASYLVTQDLGRSDFQSLYSMVKFSPDPLFSIVTAPGPLPKLDQSSQFSCLTHYDCDEGLFCSSKSLNQYAKGFRGGGGPGPNAFGCEPCKFCLSDAADPIDRFCPRDKCGPKAGSFPACVDATKLFAANFSCRDRYPIYMDRAPTATAISQSTVDAVLQSLNTNGHKARFLTPYNQLVGAVIVTQRRFKGSCEMLNDLVARYTVKKDQRLGPLCCAEGQTQTPVRLGQTQLSHLPVRCTGETWTRPSFTVDRSWTEA